ncbi:unnamed protein product, partial [Ascophyllum nodosum]
TWIFIELSSGVKPGRRTGWTPGPQAKRTSTLTWSTILELEIITPRQHLRVAARDRKVAVRAQA